MRFSVPRKDHYLCLAAGCVYLLFGVVSISNSVGRLPSKYFDLSCIILVTYDCFVQAILILLLSHIVFKNKRAITKG